MKQTKLFKGLLVATLLLCSPSLWAYDFTAKNDDGKTIYYTIVSKDDRTCEVVNIGQLNLYIGDIVIPETVTRSGTTYTVIGIGEFAFLLCYDLTSVSIPNSVTYIGTGAFEGDDKLTYIDIPNSVTSIGDSAFEGCTGLEEVTIGNSVTTIGEWAFGGCTGLTSVTIPDSVISIGYDAFQYCSGLTSLILGNGVTTIGIQAFQYCTGLTSVAIPNSVTEIEGGAFRNCTGLTFVNINNCVAEIDGHVFYGCTSLEKFEVAESNQAYTTSDGVLFSKDMTTLIAFPHGSPLLPSYDIPNGVTTIGERAFYNCSGLTSVTIGNSVTSIGSDAFQYCTGLTSVAIPNSVTEIGGGAFHECSGLTSATIGNSVTTIESSAFLECTGLTSVIIGERVDYIGQYGFRGCTSLEEIYSLNPEPPEWYGSMVFYEVDKEACTLYVPIGTYGKYSGNFVHNTNNYWKEFLNIVEMDMTGIENVIASSEDAEIVSYYTIDGKMVDVPQKGVNIIRYSDGTTKKLLVK